MAEGHGPLMAGGLVAAGLVAVVVLALGGLATSATGLATIDPGSILAILRFTVVQALLSTLLSLVFGAALALALARRQFPGRRFAIIVLAATTALPAIVVVFALTAIWGRAGLLNDLVALAGGKRLSIYGLGGILLAHVFFNVPYAARVFLGAIEAIPGEHWRLAASLGMPPSAIFRLVDWPVLRREAPALALLIFILCATSFAIPLAMGGGPGAATLEVAIYEALRFDVDFARAAMLAGLQILLLGALVAATMPLLRRPAEVAVAGRLIRRPDRAGRGLAMLDAVVLILAALLVAPPLAAMAWSGRGLFQSTDPLLVRALLTSLAVALPSAMIAVLAAYALARTRASARTLLTRGLFEAVPLLAIATPALTLAAGLYAVARHLGSTESLALPVLALVNAMTALPFAFRLIDPAVQVAEARYGRLAQSLGISGLARLRLVERPLIAAPALGALALAAALSLGDLGVIALFGSDTLVTLPYLLYQRMGAYRLAGAEAVAALLALLVLALFALADRLGQSHARHS